MCPQADNDVDLRSNDVCNYVAKRCYVLADTNTKNKALLLKCFVFWRYRPDLNWRITVLQTGALPLGYGTILKSGTLGVPDYGAGDEARTRYLHLGKVALYRMSYTRIMCRPPESNFFDSEAVKRWCLRSESNQRHVDFQSTALPTELQRHIVESNRSPQHIMATPNGLEPSTSSVTGWRANRLHHRAKFMVGTTGLEPVTPCL